MREYMTDAISENTGEDKQRSGGCCEGKNRGWLRGGTSSTQSRRARWRACCTAGRRRGPEVVLMERLSSSSRQRLQRPRAGCGGGGGWRQEEGQGTCWVTHTCTEDRKLLIAMKHLC